jgi:hypothetical protein
MATGEQSPKWILFSHFLLWCSVLPGPPLNKINSLADVLATLAAVIDDRSKQFTPTQTGRMIMRFGRDCMGQGQIYSRCLVSILDDKKREAGPRR